MTFAPLVLVLAACLGCPQQAVADWRSAPVVPRLDAAGQKSVIKTARRGIKLGNRPDVFAKVGDSISQSPAFLQSLGCGQQRLGKYRGLRPTVRTFTRRGLPGRSSECRAVNSFSRDSAATLVLRTSGWPLGAGDTVEPACRDGEPPLLCEVRLVRPAYALVLLGTNDVSFANSLGGDPQPAFLANMRRIVEVTRNLGVVPILSTLPPRPDPGPETLTERLNASLAGLAVATNAPLINLWRALYPLPSHGLYDGLHLNVSGWPGCMQPCDPSFCAPRCFAANFGRAGLMYGSDVRNLITLMTLRRVHKVATQGTTGRRPHD
jgi:hypothetical protein